MSTPHGTDADLADLRTALTRSDYTVENLDRILGPVAAAALHREQPIPARVRLTASKQPAATLALAFVLGESVGANALERALPGFGVDGALRVGLVRPDEPAEGTGRYAPTCDLRPYGDEDHAWWVASDLSELATGGPLQPDHVLGVGGASTTLASWTPRPEVQRALDLGTGCAVQALHLAAHCREVVATDVSAPALGFARFNAGLNGQVLELRHGSLLEPVAGERFDLIVSNPPFVITPRLPDVPHFEYRDGGMTGDALVAGLVAEVGAHLAPGGIAQLLGNWETRAGQDWRERVSGWLDGTGLDAWVVQRESQDPAEYADTWVRDGGHRPGTPEHASLFSSWMEDFAARAVDRIGFGIITLQRPSSPREPWRELEDVGGPVASPMGPSVLAGLRARTWLAEHSEDDLLDATWVVAPDVTEERIGRPGAPDPAVIQLRQGSGLRRVVRLSSAAAAVVGVCDGELTVRQICHAVAALTEQPVAALFVEVLPTVRALIADGLLLGSSPDSLPGTHL